ncbi:MAG: MFS transporter [Promethearchaeota archaeon]
MDEKNEKSPKRSLKKNEDLQLDQKKNILAWSMYDWANSAFATTIMAGFFPVFLGAYWAPEALMDPAQKTFLLGAWNSGASLVVVILAPILGAIADHMAGKKKFLGAFCLMGALMSAALGLLAYGQYQLALFIYALGIIGFSGANIFYDSLLPAVASEKKIDYVSSLGFSLGYVGGGLLFTLNVALYLLADLGVIGMSPDLAIKLSFVSVGVWWLIFSIPLFKTVPEPYVAEKITVKEAISGGFKQLGDTFRDISKLKYVGLFLFAFWLYIDGVDTIIRMALDYGDSLESVDLGATELIIILLMVQFIAFPGTLLYNLFAQKIGIKNGLLVAIAGYGCITILGYFISENWHFYVLGGMIGLFQGGIQALSRSLYSRIIPKKKAAEFYGFFNMWGKFAAVIGPIMMGAVTRATGNPRYGILSILSLFVFGGIALFFVDIEKGEAIAKKFDEELDLA